MIQINSDLLPELARKHCEAIVAFLDEKVDKKFNSGSQGLKKVNKLLKENNLDLKTVIVANPAELDAIAKKIKTKKGEEFDFFKRFYAEFISKSNPKKSFTYRLSKAVKELNIHVCPYCNANYIYGFELSTKKDQNGNVDLGRTYQYDHYYPKSTYPYLAVSFYNLIPVCKDCNLLKGEKRIDINPYDQTRNLASISKFKYKIAKANIYSRDPEVVTLELPKHKDLEKHNSSLKLDKRYDHRKDLVLEAIHKRQMYSDEYIDQLYKKYKGTLFTSKEDVLRYVSGNYVTDDGFLKRPFSKLNKDIWEQLDE